MNLKSILKKSMASVLAVTLGVAAVNMGFMKADAASNAKNLSAFKNVDIYKYIRIKSEDELLDFSKRASRGITGRDLEYTGPEYGWGWTSDEKGQKEKVTGLRQLFNISNDRSSNFENNDWGIMLVFKSEQTNTERYLGGNRGFCTDSDVDTANTFEIKSTANDLRYFDTSLDTQYMLTAGQIPVMYFGTATGSYDKEIFYYLKALNARYPNWYSCPESNSGVFNRYFFALRTDLGEVSNDCYVVEKDSVENGREFHTYHKKASWFHIIFNQSNGKAIFLNDEKESVLNESAEDSSDNGDMGATYVNAYLNNGVYSSPNVDNKTEFDMWVCYKDSSYGCTLDSGNWVVPSGNTVTSSKSLTYINKDTTITVYGDMVIDGEFRLAGKLIVYGNVIVKDGGKLCTNFRNDTGSICLYKDKSSKSDSQLQGNLIVENGGEVIINKKNTADTNGYIDLAGGSIICDGSMSFNFLNSTTGNGNGTFIKVQDNYYPCTIRFEDDGKLYLAPNKSKTYTDYFNIILSEGTTERKSKFIVKSVISR